MSCLNDNMAALFFNYYLNGGEKNLSGEIYIRNIPSDRTKMNFLNESLPLKVNPSTFLTSFPVTTLVPDTPRLNNIEPISETLFGSLSKPIVVRVIAKFWKFIEIKTLDLSSLIFFPCRVSFYFLPSV